MGMSGVNEREKEKGIGVILMLFSDELKRKFSSCFPSFFLEVSLYTLRMDCVGQALSPFNDLSCSYSA